MLAFIQDPPLTMPSNKTKQVVETVDCKQQLSTCPLNHNRKSDCFPKLCYSIPKEVGVVYTWNKANDQPLSLIRYDHVQLSPPPPLPQNRML